jgi:ribosomal-protein-alanine N-acetyltransferase
MPGRAQLQKKTSRLVVRPLILTDFQAWRDANLTAGRPRNTWDAGPRPPEELTRGQFRAILSEQRKRREKDYYYDLAVFDTEGTLIGGVSLMEVARGISHTAYLGYRIFNGYWGMGYGKEAVKAMISIGFDDLSLHRIEAGIEPGNTRSIKLARSLGMRREGVKKRAVFLRKHWVDLIMYTLTAEDVGKRFDASRLKMNRRS